jgi:putative two-component system response regulator
MRVLIVDDNALALELLKAALARAGHAVETASHGQEAMDTLQKSACRLVIADWEMPVMDGLQLCRAIRASNLPAYVYVILLTARHEPHSKVEGLSAGADDFMTKPFDQAELTVRIRTAERILALETRELAIFALAKLAESRDPDTGTHLERVRTYTHLLALELAGVPGCAREMDPDYARTIYLTSPLHDIGKVAIPDCVLLKPGRLNDREFDIMKTHTVLGAQTLQASLDRYPEARFLQMASQIALTHHERWDGSGYPGGLKGLEIPLCGRIMAMADVYDALTSKRVYKSAFTHDVARAIIIDGSAGHFDPDIVQAFLRCERQFAQLQSECPDAEYRDAA